MGCLVVVGDNDKVVSGIVRERDYIHKVSFLGLDSKQIDVESICQSGTSMIVAKRSDSVHKCAQKFIDSEARHLPVVADDTNEFCGLISGSDLMRALICERDRICMKLNLDGN